MTFRALLASTCLATALVTGTTAFAQDNYGSPGVTEIDAVYYVTWLEATVREQPSSSALAIADVYMGDRIYVTGRVDGTEWVRIAVDSGGWGYMWGGVLAPAMVGGSVAAPAAPVPPASANDDVRADNAGNSIYEAFEIGNMDAGDVNFDDYVGTDDLDDYYAIDVTDWTFIDIAVEGLSSDADLMLVDEYENIIGSSEMAGAVSEYVQQTIPAGRYYVRVTAYEGETDYTLYLYSEPTTPPPPDTVGDTMETATAIDAPGDVVQTYTERLDISDHDDWYAFTVDDYMEVSISLYGLQSDLDLAIVDANGTAVATSENGTNTDEFAVAVVGPGTHYVHVYVYTGQSDYSLDVSGVPSAPPPPDNAGNSSDQALDLGVLDAATGLTASDWVGPGDLDDWFAFNVGSPMALTVNLDGIVGDLDLELLDSNGEIVSVSNNSGNAAEMIAANVQPGRYFAHVYAFDGNSEFSLSINGETQP